MVVKLTSESKIVRSPAFGARLRAACDAKPECPDLNKGRLTWLQSELRKRGLIVSVEAVRRWLSGEGKPREATCEKLADALGTDGVLLYMGSTSSSPTPGLISRYEELVLPIEIRPGLTVKIAGLPVDLSLSEATRIANIVKAHAQLESEL